MYQQAFGVSCYLREKKGGRRGSILSMKFIESEQEELREVRDVTYLCLFVGINLRRNIFSNFITLYNGC